jgi:hypothetical protein
MNEFERAAAEEKRSIDRIMPRFIKPAANPPAYKPLPKLPPATQQPIKQNHK